MTDRPALLLDLDATQLQRLVPRQGVLVHAVGERVPARPGVAQGAGVEWHQALGVADPPPHRHERRPAGGEPGARDWARVERERSGEDENGARASLCGAIARRAPTPRREG